MPLHLTLKVDVDTLRGTQEGVPRLVDLFARRKIAATFLFSLGPDHTGRAIKRIFRPGFFSKVQRTSVLEHYGLRTLLYGTLLPGPDIGKTCAEILRATRDAGHETGIHAWDHIAWQDAVRERDTHWTHQHMQRAYERYVEIFRQAPTTHGAAGWQMNAHALHQLDHWNLPYASDVRIASGSNIGAFQPRIHHQNHHHRLHCVQIPTTLPTLDELIGVDGMDAHGAAQSLLAVTQAQPRDHVFTLHSELEGAKLLPVFEMLLDR